MDEPNNPDQYYIYHGYTTHEGKYGYAKIKKWNDADGFKHEKILAFVVEDHERLSDQTNT